MKTVEFFEDLFVYNFHANQAFIACFEKQGTEGLDKALDFLNHLLNAHHVWNSRILNESSYGIWEIHPFECLTKINALNVDKTNYILKHFDMDTVIQYKNSQGHPFENTVQDILLQINNHSCYHRGQIAYNMRLNNYDPVPTDYILYKRKGILS